MQMYSKKNRLLAYHDTYVNEVLPILSDIEYTRLGILNELRNIVLLIYLSPLTILAIFMCVQIQEGNPAYFILLFFLIPVLVILHCYVRYHHNKKFRNMAKTKILPVLLKSFGGITWIAHDPTKKNLDGVRVENTELDRSGLFISYNTRYTDDEFKGSYKGIPFKISETKMFDIHGSGKQRRCICAFEGVILSFKFNKKINNRTIVATKWDLTKKSQLLMTMLMWILPISIGVLQGGYAHWKLVLSIMILVGGFFIVNSFEKKEEALDKVLLEDPKFDKRFDVYSSDQVEARYLVTPSFMERFYNLKTAFGAKKIKCSFYDDTFMVAISTSKNLFEVCSLFKSLRDPSYMQEFYKELDSVYKMIDHFKLYEKTGL